MSQVFTCPAGPTHNPDGTISCSSWLLVDLPAPDPIHDLTPEQLSEITGSILLAFAVAWSFRVLVRFILQSNYGKNP